MSRSQTPETDPRKIELCRLIKQNRLASGLSQTKYAKSIGMCQSHFSHIENGDHFTFDCLFAVLEKQGWECDVIPMRKPSETLFFGIEPAVPGADKTAEWDGKLASQRNQVQDPLSETYE